jgi:hypothetical protein
MRQAAGPTATDIVRSAGSWFDAVADHPYGLVVTIRRKEYKFLPTYYTALAAQGVPLNAAARFELDFLRQQQARYVDLERALVRAVPGLRALKGSSLATSYPPGIVRFIGDVDLVAADAEAFWAAARRLVGDGWELGTLLSFRHAGRTEYVAELMAPLTDPLMPRDMVELATVTHLGNRLGVPPVAATEPACSRAVQDLLAIAHEGVERAFGLRDVLDVTVLRRTLQADEVTALLDTADRWLLLSELDRLLGTAVRAGLLTRAERPWIAPGRLAAGRARRARVAADRWRHPPGAALNLLQRRFSFGSRKNLSARLWRRVSGHLRPETLGNAELLEYALQVRPTGRERRDSPRLLESPLGTFVLTPSDEIAEEWLAELGVADPTA